MYKISRFLIIPVVALVFIQLEGCKKKPDMKPPQAELCDITHIKYLFISQENDAAFTYNTHGDPVSVTVSHPGTANANVIFLYDQYHRLTDFIEPYAKLDPANLPNQITYEYWIRYTYADLNPASMPIADTARTFGIHENGQFTVQTVPMDVETYTYDSQGRIIKINTVTVRDSHIINTSKDYNYNASGNLVLQNVTYDDKTSFRRTNKIWQLVDRNYSLNNSFIATSYNDEGLPTVIPNSITSFLYHGGIALSTIDYSCGTKLGDSY